LCEKIHAQFIKNPNPIVIYGQGGIGKTTLARRYAELHSEDYKIKLSMEFYDNIKTTLLNGENNWSFLADNFQKLNSDKKIKLILNHLGSCKKTYLIRIDINKHNFKKIDCSDLPKNKNVKFIFTTRNEKLLPLYHKIKADKLGVEDLKIIFKNNYFKNENDVLKTDEEENLEKIITEIYKFNTKLIVLGATSCKYSHININKFYKILANDKFAKELKEKFKTDEDLNEKQMCQHVLKLFSISGIKRKLKKVLTYMSLIDYDGVKIELFKKWLKLKSFDFLNELSERSWVEFGEDDESDVTILMHPVISDAVFEQTRWTYRKCEKFLDRIFYGVNKQNAYEHLYLIGILEFIIKRFSKENKSSIYSLKKSFYIFNTKEMEMLLKFRDNIIKIYIQALNEEYLSTDTMYPMFDLNDGCGCGSCFGVILYIIEKIYRCSTKMSANVKRLAKVHPSTVTSYYTINLAYDNIGNYEKALDYHFKAKEIFEKVLGKDHPDTATSYNNIGNVYKKQGNYEKALEYCFKALEIRENKLGKNHPLTKATYENIAVTYYNFGDNENAKKYFRLAGLDV
jgi:tetratricopeptide (TPR) repeat protein